MRIALMTESFLPKIDGIVTMVTKTVECLRQSGDEVMVFAPSGGPSELFGAEVVAMPSVPFPLYPELRLALPRAFMREKLVAFDPEVIHVFEPALLGLGGLYYSEVLRVPLVVSYHTNLPTYLRYYKLGAIEKLTWKLMRERHRRANVNLCTSTPMIQDLRDHGIKDLALWERAVDADRFRPGAGSAEMRNFLSDGKPERPLLLYVGRLSAEKDIASLREVLHAMPEASLAIVGDGPLRGELEKHFKGTQTFFTGYLRGDALASAYASSDLFVLPSQTETLGLVLLEAMASGCPVVACRAGGVPDAVQAGQNGFLFEPGDREGMVKTVKQVLADRCQRETICESALHDVEARSWQRATDQLKVHYGEAIRKGVPVKVAAPRSLSKRLSLSTLRALLP